MTFRTSGSLALLYNMRKGAIGHAFRFLGDLEPSTVGNYHLRTHEISCHNDGLVPLIRYRYF